MPKFTVQLASKIKLLNLVYIKCLELIKYKLDNTIKDYIELSVSIALTSGLGNKVITYLENDKLFNSRYSKDVEKFSNIVDDYVGQTMQTKLLLTKFHAVEGLKMGDRINLVLKELRKLPKDLQNVEVISVLKIGGLVEDSDILELGGFLDTVKIVYPTTLFATISKLQGDEEEKVFTKWRGIIVSYFLPIVNRIDEYLIKRAKYNNFTGLDTKNTSDRRSFDSVIRAIDLIREQDLAILNDKLENMTVLSPKEVKKNIEAIKVLRLNPRRRSEILSEILEDMSDFETLYYNLDTPIDNNGIRQEKDKKIIDLIEKLNKIGFAIDYLLSKENKITCINNIYFVLETYISVLEGDQNQEFVDFMKDIIGIKIDGSEKLDKKRLADIVLTN